MAVQAPAPTDVAGGEGGAVTPAMTGCADALLLELGMSVYGGAVVPGAGAVAVAAAAMLADATADAAPPGADAVGRDVPGAGADDALVAGGVDAVGVTGGGQTPEGDGGVELSLWPSYRKPSASPSPKVCDEMPRLDVCHPAPPRLTNIAQYGLLAVQHPGGYCWGSLSIWQTALPVDP
jgi:hypothetical protein